MITLNRQAVTNRLESLTDDAIWSFRSGRKFADDGLRRTRLAGLLAGNRAIGRQNQPYQWNVIRSDVDNAVKESLNRYCVDQTTVP